MTKETIKSSHVIVRTKFCVYQLVIGNKAYVGVLSREHSSSVYTLLFGVYGYPYMSNIGHQMINTDELRAECQKDSYEFCNSRTEIVERVDSPYEAYQSAQYLQARLSEQYEVLSKNPGRYFKKMKFYHNDEIAEMQAELDELMKTETYSDAWYKVRSKHGIKGRTPAYTPGLKCIEVEECS